LTFDEWHSSAPHGNAPAMNEDAQGTVSVDPKFKHTGQPTDFLLTSNPAPGFDYTKTNDAILHAGRSNPVIKVGPVMATFPHYSAKKN